MRTQLFWHPKTGVFVGEQQARYAGAIGARAIHKLRSFAVEDIPLQQCVYAHRPSRRRLIKSFSMETKPDQRASG